MYELINEWTQDGFDLKAYTTPDQDIGHPNVEFGQSMDDDTWRTYVNRYEQGDWYWIGVIVEASMQDVKLGNASLWGIESDQPGYHLQVADEIAEDAIDEAAQTLAELLEEYEHAS